jgi:hypothetical protein
LLDAFGRKASKSGSNGKVYEDELIMHHDLAQRNWDLFIQHGAGTDKVVELALFPARVESIS